MTTNLARRRFLGTTAATAGSLVVGFHDLFARCTGQDYLVFSIDSDLSFHTEEQARLVNLLKKSQVPVMWITVHSDKGHDSFLLEPRLYTPHLAQVLHR